MFPIRQDVFDSTHLHKEKEGVQRNDQPPLQLLGKVGHLAKSFVGRTKYSSL